MPNRKNLLILDLSEIKLTEVTRKYPNLWKLVATGSTGLVNFTRNSVDGTIVNRLQKQRLIRGDINLIVLKRFTPIPGEQNNEFQSSNRKVYLQSGRSNLLFHFDRMAKQIIRETDFQTTLILSCFSWEGLNSKNQNAGMTAVVLKGLSFNRGVLYSPSTRKPGIITFNDLKYTVQQFHHPEIPPVFRIKNLPGYWRNIAKSQTELIQNYMVRWPILTVYGYLMLGLFGTLVVKAFLRFHHLTATALVQFYIFLLAVPGAFLLMAMINPLDWTSIIFYSLGITGVLFLLSYFVAGKKLPPTLAWLSFLTAGLILADGLFNGHYEYKSFLGYSAISGTRYHGIGNEYMGILLGAYISGISLTIDKLGHWRKEILWTLTFLICMILIHPCFGADVGGGISALMGLGITNYLWMSQPVRFREIGQLSILTALALTLAAIWDLFLNRTDMSHWGQLLVAIQNRGWEACQTIIVRKLEMNLRLIKTTPLAILLILILLAIPALYRYSPVPIKRLKEKYPVLISGFTGLSITALVGLMVNDSGIVSAALIFMFGFGLIALVINSELGLDN